MDDLSAKNDLLHFYDVAVTSRLLVGTAQYPSPAILAAALRASHAEIVTVSLRREAGGGRAGESFWELIRSLGLRVLPNTAGCRTVKEAVATAQMARELFGTPWIKLEVIGEEDLLAPDVFGLVEAARILCDDGFHVFPYTTEDLVVAEKLLDAGCKVMTRCCSIPPSPGPAILSPWRALSLRLATRDAPPFEPCRWSLATWLNPRRRCLARLLHETRPFLPHRRSRRMAAPPAALRRQTRAVAHQRRVGGRDFRPDS
jgi:thiazole synthase